MNALTLYLSTRFSAILPHWVVTLSRFNCPHLQSILLLSLFHFAGQTFFTLFNLQSGHWLLPGLHSLLVTTLALIYFIKPLRNSDYSLIFQLLWLNVYCTVITSVAPLQLNVNWFFYLQISVIVFISVARLVSFIHTKYSAQHLLKSALKFASVIALPVISVVVVNSQLFMSSAALPIPARESVALFEGFLHGVVVLYTIALLKPVISPFIKARLIEYVQHDMSIQRRVLDESDQRDPHTTKSTSKPSAHYLDQVSILFADMQNFSELMQHNATEQVVAFLHDVFNEFDDLCSEFGVAKIKTAGDQYMAAAGVPFPHPNHASHCCLLALAMRARFSTICRKHNMKTALRIGISSGSVVAGFVGNDKRSYDLWGEAVNLAARMESTGEANKIQLSHSTYQLVWKQFAFEPVRQIPVKGFGITSCHYLKDFAHETHSGRHNLLATILAKTT